MGDVCRLEKCIGYVFWNFMEFGRNENFDGDNFSIKSIVMCKKALLVRFHEYSKERENIRNWRDDIIHIKPSRCSQRSSCCNLFQLY